MSEASTPEPQVRAYQITGRAGCGAKVIRREFLGGSEEVSFEEFCEQVVQSDEVAEQIAERMLAGPDEAYAYNAAEPECYERFTVIDADALRRELEARQP